MVVPIWMLIVPRDFIIRYDLVELEVHRYCSNSKATSPRRTNRGQRNRGVTHQPVVAIHFLVSWQRLLSAVSSSFYLRVCTIA